MRIVVVNPNTTATMTATIAAAATAAASPGTEIVARTSTIGPVSIESHYDEALAVPGLLAAMATEPADGYVIACFGDPGLDAAREATAAPVVGIAEAAMRTAAYLGRGYSVVTTLRRTAGRARDLAERYGAARACLAVRACEIPVLALDDPAAREAIALECRRAVDEDGCDAIVLGCAGMADLCAHLSDAVGVPVVDGVAAATRAVESLVALGLRTGKRGEFATPPAKRYEGLLRDFGYQCFGDHNSG